jgi:hypothetical protein
LLSSSSPSSISPCAHHPLTILVCFVSICLAWVSPSLSHHPRPFKVSHAKIPMLFFLCLFFCSFWKFNYLSFCYSYLLLECYEVSKVWYMHTLKKKMRFLRNIDCHLIHPSWQTTKHYRIWNQRVGCCRA